MPLTLVVLDEVEQYIADSTQRSNGCARSC